MNDIFFFFTFAEEANLLPQQMFPGTANGETFASATMFAQHCSLVCGRLYDRAKLYFEVIFLSTSLWKIINPLRWFPITWWDGHLHYNRIKFPRDFSLLFCAATWPLWRQVKAVYGQPRSHGPLSSFLEEGRERTLGTRLVYGVFSRDVTAAMLVSLN